MERKIPILMLVLAILGFTYMLAPIVVVVMAGLTAGEFLTFPPQGFSLRWVAAFLQSESYLSAFFFSFRLALMTMVVSTILGTAAALYLSHTNIVGRGAMRAFFLSPVVLPGVVVGFALFSFYISTGIGLSRTIWGLWIGHILYSTPYVIGTVGAALAAYDKSLDEAARSLGSSPWRAFRKVTLPNISQGIQAGSIFAFIVSFGEGFLMRVEAARFALARPRPALENLPGWKPRGSWIRLWGKRAVGWGNRCIRGAAEGAHGARYARMHG